MHARGQGLRSCCMRMAGGLQRSEREQAIPETSRSSSENRQPYERRNVPRRRASVQARHPPQTLRRQGNRRQDHTPALRRPGDHPLGGNPRCAHQKSQPERHQRQHQRRLRRGKRGLRGILPQHGPPGGVGPRRGTRGREEGGADRRRRADLDGVEAGALVDEDAGFS